MEPQANKTMSDVLRDLPGTGSSPISPPRASTVARSSDYDLRNDATFAALQQATMRVNSMSISEPPLLRKRNRESDDHSFRVDKMSDAPGTVPRSQAVLAPEDYQQQQMAKDQQQQAQMMSSQSVPAHLARDDSFTTQYIIPLLLSHTNSGTSGRSNSGSLLNFMTPSDSLLQDPGLTSIPPSQSSASPTPGGDWALGSNSLQGFNAVSQAGALKQGGGSGSLGLPQGSANFGLLQSQSLGGGSGSFGLGTPAFLTSQSSGGGSGFSAMFQPSLNNPALFNSQTSGNLFPSVSNAPLSFNSTNFNISMSSLGIPANSMPVGMQNSSFVNSPLGSLGGSPLTVDALVSSQIGPLNERSSAQSMGGPPMNFALFGNAYSLAKSAAQPDMSGSSAGPSPLRKSPVTASSKPRKSSSLASSAQAELKSAKQKVFDMDDKSEKYIAWSADQESILIQAVEEFGTTNWELIASKIPGPHRTGAQCMRHWENKLSPHIKRGQWSPEEDEALKELVERAAARGLGLLDIPWEEIKPFIPGRTLKQVRERWRSNLDPSIVRGEWTQEEDDMIVHMRDVQGMGWASIARALKGRTEHSVKTRHRSMQRAKKRPWTEKEDRTIIEMVKAGADFGIIANELKNRTAASVQIRWDELRNGVYGVAAN